VLSVPCERHAMARDFGECARMRATERNAEDRRDKATGMRRRVRRRRRAGRNSFGDDRGEDARDGDDDESKDVVSNSL